MPWEILPAENKFSRRRGCTYTICIKSVFFNKLIWVNETLTSVLIYYEGVAHEKQMIPKATKILLLRKACNYSLHRVNRYIIHTLNHFLTATPPSSFPCAFKNSSVRFYLETEQFRALLNYLVSLIIENRSFALKSIHWLQLIREKRVDWLRIRKYNNQVLLIF